MNLHEYQAKELLKSYGLPIQEGIIAITATKLLLLLIKRQQTLR